MEVLSNWTTDIPFLKKIPTIELIQLYQDIKNFPGINPQEIHNYREELKYCGIDIEHLRNDYSIMYKTLAISKQIIAECDRIVKG